MTRTEESSYKIPRGSHKSHTQSITIRFHKYQEFENADCYIIYSELKML